HDFAAAAGSVKNEVFELMETLSPHIGELRSSSELLQNITDDSSRKMAEANEMLLEYGGKTNETVSHISGLLAEQTQRLEQVATRAVGGCDEIFGRLDSGVEKIENTLKGQSKFIIDHIESLNR